MWIQLSSPVLEFSKSKITLGAPFSLMLLQYTLRVCPESHRFPHLLCHPLFRASAPPYPLTGPCFCSQGGGEVMPLEYLPNHVTPPPNPVKWHPSPSLTSLQWLKDGPGSAAPPYRVHHLSALLSPLLPPYYITLASKAPGFVRNFHWTVSSPWESLPLGNKHDGLSTSYIFPENLTLTTHFNIFIS